MLRNINLEIEKGKTVALVGQSGSGKTTLAEELMRLLAPDAVHLNADAVRKVNNDWDFSREGRIRQSHRMRDLADESNTDYCIVDFVAPLVEMRDNQPKVKDTYFSETLFKSFE